MAECCMNAIFYTQLQRFSILIINFVHYTYTMIKGIVLGLMLVGSNLLMAQMINSKLQFIKGDTIHITTHVKSTVSQQAMGQSIDFMVDADAQHFYRVTNTNNENSTLNHQIQVIRFAFDGMGQKRNFDSNNEKDINGQLGKPIKEILSKKYDVIIDTTGNTLLAIPEKITLTQTDARWQIITNLMKDITDIVHPPAIGAASIFKILPSSGAQKGDSWTESSDKAPDNYINYTLTSITDTTLVIDFIGASNTETTTEMMGNTATTRLNNKITGKIIANIQTGLLKEKTIVTVSTGNTETSFGTLPINSTTNVSIKAN
ncbi:MAG: hypothetical protein RIR12_811 [Bacteroidota bacterium]